MHLLYKRSGNIWHGVWLRQHKTIKTALKIPNNQTKNSVKSRKSAENPNLNFYHLTFEASVLLVTLKLLKAALNRMILPPPDPWFNGLDWEFYHVSGLSSQRSILYQLNRVIMQLDVIVRLTPNASSLTEYFWENDYLNSSNPLRKKVLWKRSGWRDTGAPPLKRNSLE